MLKVVKASFLKIRKNIFFFGLINCAAYMILSFKLFNMRQMSGMSILLNNVILCCISFYQIKRWVEKTGTALSFLRAFSLVAFTGIWSFLLFGIFLIVYSNIDPVFIQLYITNTYETIRFTPIILIVFEGAAGSVIVGLIAMMYSDRYADNEKKI